MAHEFAFRRSLGSLAVVGLGAGVLAGCSSESTAAAAGGDCSDLDGETISLVVPFSPGGGYDVYARMIAPYLEEELGATIAVENQPGAGGLLAVNSLLTAKPDGTTIAIMNGVGAGGSSIAGADGAHFALDELTQLGRVAGEPTLVMTSGEGPYQAWTDVAQADGFRWGATGPGAEDYLTPSILTAVFELDAEVVSGFAGSGEIETAVLQGNLDGMSGEPDSHRPAIEAGSKMPVLVMGQDSPEWLPGDVPLVTELDMTAEQQEIIDAQVALMELGRPLVAPPGMDEGLTTCFRDAVAAAMENPELLADAEELQRPVDFLTGEEVDDLVTSILDSPAAYKELLASLY